MLMSSASGVGVIVDLVFWLNSRSRCASQMVSPNTVTETKDLISRCELRASTSFTLFLFRSLRQNKHHRKHTPCLYNCNWGVFVISQFVLVGKRRSRKSVSKIGSGFTSFIVLLLLLSLLFFPHASQDVNSSITIWPNPPIATNELASIPNIRW